MKNKYARIIFIFALSAALVFALTACKPAEEEEEIPRAEYTVTITGGAGSGKYFENKNCTAKAITPSGKQFMVWLVDGEPVSQNEIYIFTVTQDVEVVAQYEDEIPDMYRTVRTVSVIDGVGSGKYFDGTVCTASISIAINQVFIGWYDADGVRKSSNNPYLFFVLEDIELSARTRDVEATYVFEAEDADLSEFISPAGSFYGNGCPLYPGTVYDDDGVPVPVPEGREASGGMSVNYFDQIGSQIIWKFTSDREATVNLSISVACAKSVAYIYSGRWTGQSSRGIADDTYVVQLNGTKIPLWDDLGDRVREIDFLSGTPSKNEYYDHINLSHIKTIQSSGLNVNMSVFTSNIRLKVQKGENTVVMEVGAGIDATVGTGTGPSIVSNALNIDCLKVTTMALLEFQPVNNFNMYNIF